MMLFSSKLKRRTLLLLGTIMAGASVDGFLHLAASTAKCSGTLHHPTTRLDYSRGDSDSDGYQLLNQRIKMLKLSILEEEFRRPPNAGLSPEELITEIMNGLLYPDDPLPDSGFRLLLRASTQQWRSKIMHSVGAPTGENINMDLVASALGTAIGRPNNQYAILVGEEEEYSFSFDYDPIDYYDGDCWVECKLRDKKSGKLLVITGWQLKKRNIDGAWLVDGIDWQDFRDKYRPGIGREEWMRVCG